jgi:hypothetical protein
MSAPYVPEFNHRDMEMCRKGGTLRLDAKDWAAVMLTAFDYGWSPSGKRARIYAEAAFVLSGPEDRLMTLLFASEEQDQMRRSGLGHPAFARRDAEELAGALTTALKYATSADSEPPDGNPMHRLLMREFDGERSVEWRAVNRTQVINEVIAFARQGRFEIPESLV